MRDIPINLFKGRHPSTFIKFVNLINRLDRDGKGCYAKDEWFARKLEVCANTITNYFACAKALGYCSVINSDKRNRLVIGYDSIKKRMQQEQESSQQTDETKSSATSTDNGKGWGFNPQAVGGRNTIENDPKNLNKSEEREKEKEEVAGIRTMDIMSNLYIKRILD